MHKVTNQSELATCICFPFIYLCDQNMTEREEGPYNTLPSPEMKVCKNMSKGIFCKTGTPLWVKLVKKLYKEIAASRGSRKM